MIIETERLSLCKFTLEDTDFIRDLFSDAMVKQFIGDRGIQTQVDAHNYILNGPVSSYAQHGFGLLSVRLKRDNALLGMCGLLQRNSLDDVDIGYAFLPQYRGQGYALEAATAVTNYAKNTLKLNRIVAITAPDNTKSIKLLDKLGFHFDKMIKLSAEGEESKLFVSEFGRYRDE